MRSLPFFRFDRPVHVRAHVLGRAWTHGQVLGVVPDVVPGWVGALVLGLGLGLGPGLPLAHAQAADTISGTATVIDAGTLKIQGKKVRLHGIEGPEDDQVCLRDAKPWKCGEAAATALRQYVSGKTVACEAVAAADGSNAGANCKVDGQSLNGLLVREGWAMDLPAESRGTYAEAQKEAKKARRGVWASETDNPEEIRRQGRE